MAVNDNQNAGGVAEGLGNLSDIAGDILKNATPAPSPTLQNSNNPGDDEPSPEDLEAQRQAAAQKEFDDKNQTKTLGDVIDEEKDKNPKPIITDKDKGNQPPGDDEDFGDNFLEVPKAKLPAADPKEGDQPTELPQDAQVKIAEYDQIFQDEFLATIIKARMAGDDISKIVSEMQPVDITKLSPEEMIERHCRAKGLTDEEITEELDHYSDIKSPLQRKEYLEGVKSKLTEHEKSRSSAALKNAGSNYERQIQIRDKFITDLQSETQKLEGREMYGYKVTKEDVASMYNYGIQFNPVNPDGTINSKLIAQHAFAKVLLPQIAKKNLAAGHSRGEAGILDQINRPDASGAPSNTRSTSPEQVSGMKLVDQVTEKLGG